MDAAESFDRLTGKNLSIISWGSLFYSPGYCAGGWCNFQTTEFDAVRGYGALPLFSWGPTWSRSVDAKIARGDYDSYLTTWAKAAKAWGHPFFLRFAWEMNGSWFPWGVGGSGIAAGNTPSSYVAMWRHVYTLFQHAGATNVTWVWCPNVTANSTYHPLSALYPGNRYVNWTCIDGYNGDNPWRSFGSIYGDTYASVMSVAPRKPMLVGEVSSTEAGGSKAAWINSMFATLPSLFPNIRGVLWYEANAPGPGGHRDWTVDSSPSSLRALRAGLKSPLYRSNTYSGAHIAPIPAP
jgi:hypothetical protein